MFCLSFHETKHDPFLIRSSGQYFEEYSHLKAREMFYTSNDGIQHDLTFFLRCTKCQGQHFSRRCLKNPCAICNELECMGKKEFKKFYFDCKGECKALHGQVLRCRGKTQGEPGGEWRCCACDTVVERLKSE